MGKEDYIGSLWKKHGQYGEFMTGTIDFMGRTLKIVVSPNKPDWIAAKERRPDFSIKLDTWEPQGRRETPEAGLPPMEKRENVPSVPIAREPRREIKEPSFDGFTDDIPF